MYWNTVKPLLKNVLVDVMNEDLFLPFRLVGGTALSLQIGHRISVDIDLFTNASYGSVDFKKIKDFFEEKYEYCSYRSIENVGMGIYFEVGNSIDDFVKIDIYYTDDFVFDQLIIEDIRMASEKEIIAMKLAVIDQNGRKKDFWDLHYYIEKLHIDEMIGFYKKRYPYHDYSNLKRQCIKFERADEDFDPICLLSKNWFDIKLDFVEKLQSTIMP
jgi:predicted nucleotidyltransferase component of viral defense system